MSNDRLVINEGAYWVCEECSKRMQKILDRCPEHPMSDLYLADENGDAIDLSSEEVLTLLALLNKGSTNN